MYDVIMYEFIKQCNKETLAEWTSYSILRSKRYFNVQNRAYIPLHSRIWCHMSSLVFGIKVNDTSWINNLLCIYGKLKSIFLRKDFYWCYMHHEHQFAEKWFFIRTKFLSSSYKKSWVHSHCIMQLPVLEKLL